MSIETIQSRINRLYDEIAKYNKKIADEQRKAANNRHDAERITIGKNDSASTQKSKMSKKQNYLTKAADADKKIADYQKEIARLSEKLNRENKNLQKEEASQRKKDIKQQQDLKKQYEDRIKELESQKVQAYSLNVPLTEVYFQEKDVHEKYDVFVSYASEDKEFAQSFVEELKKKGVKVWFDQSALGWGDNLRKGIDQGLKKSQYGIVILSPDYIKPGKYWTTHELEGLMQVEGDLQHKLLPVWHHLTKQEVLDYSPILASKKALTTADFTAEELANEFKILLNNKLEGE